MNRDGLRWTTEPVPPTVNASRISRKQADDPETPDRPAARPGDEPDRAHQHDGAENVSPQ